MNKKTINLRGLQAKLSAKELKNVLGGSGGNQKGVCCKTVSALGTDQCFHSFDVDSCNVDDICAPCLDELPNGETFNHCTCA